MIVERLEDVGLGFKQSFKYTPLPFGSYSANTILELIKSGVIDRDVIKVTLFLYKFKCATVEYITKNVDLDDERKLVRKLDELVRNRIFNEFVLSDSNDLFDSKGLVFYTLDYGAILLLRCPGSPFVKTKKIVEKDEEEEYVGGKDIITNENDFTESDNLDNWKATDLFMSGTKALKSLTLIDFCRSLGEVEYFNTNELFSSYGAKVRTKANFKQGDKTYLVEVVANNDLLEESDSNVTEKLVRYEQLLGTDGWTYYFKELPTLLIICDSPKAKELVEFRMKDSKVLNIEYLIMKNR